MKKFKIIVYAKYIWLLLSEVTPPYPITFDQNLLETSWVVNTCKIARVIDSDYLFCDLKSLKIQYGRSRHLGAILAPFTAPKNFLNYPTHFVFQKPFRHVSVIFSIFCGSRDIRKVISLRPAGRPAGVQLSVIFVFFRKISRAIVSERKDIESSKFFCGVVVLGTLMLQSFNYVAFVVPELQHRQNRKSAGLLLVHWQDLKNWDSKELCNYLFFACLYKGPGVKWDHASKSGRSCVSAPRKSARRGAQVRLSKKFVPKFFLSETFVCCACVSEIE